MRATALALDSVVASLLRFTGEWLGFPAGRR